MSIPKRRGWSRQIVTTRPRRTPRRWVVLEHGRPRPGAAARRQVWARWREVARAIRAMADSDL